MSRYLLTVLILLPIVGCAQPEPLSSMCLARNASSYNETDNLRLNALTLKILTTHQFGLFSFVYSLMPTDGHPLTFDADGTVNAMQFNGARWALQNGEVQLWNTNDEVFRTFRYDSRCNSLTSTVFMGGRAILMEIAIVNPAT